MTVSDRYNGRSACHVDWVMNGLRWKDLFFNLPDGITHADAVRQAEMRLPLFKRGYRAEDHAFGYQIVGCADSPPGHSYPFDS